jgi:hypothetical protein
MINPSLLLRRALQLDTLATGAMAVLLTFGAGYLASFLNLPETFLRISGVALIGWTAIVGFLATRDVMSKAIVWAVIAGNAVWTIDSLALLATSWIAPNTLGIAFIVMQAVAVGLFAELQYMGLRKSEGVAAAR